MASREFATLPGVCRVRLNIGGCSSAVDRARPSAWLRPLAQASCDAVRQRIWWGTSDEQTISLDSGNAGGRDGGRALRRVGDRCLGWAWRPRRAGAAAFGSAKLQRASHAPRNGAGALQRYERSRVWGWSSPLHLQHGCRWERDTRLREPNVFDKHTTEHVGNGQ
jgi:hypothetical protein